MPPYLEMTVEGNPRHRTIAIWLTVRRPNAKTVELCETVQADDRAMMLVRRDFRAAIPRLYRLLEQVILRDQAEPAGAIVGRDRLGYDSGDLCPEGRQ